jgi:putative endonuclease
MTSKNKTVLYIGVTNNLLRRVWEHRTHYNPDAFTAKYNATSCIYYEYFADVEQAICREKELKSWNRGKKEALINAKNPAWEDLWEKIKKMVI